MEKSTNRKPLYFLVATGILSALLFGLLALLENAKAPNAVIVIAQCLTAWGPSLAVLVLFRTLYPNRNFWEYLKETFCTKINLFTFILLLFVQIGIFLLAVLVYSCSSGQRLSDLTFVSWSAVPFLLVTQFFSGALGEELGWRGYLLRDLEKRHSLFMAALITGIIWGLWHFPVWLSLPYAGLDLFRYIVLFLIEILAFSIIMAVFYHRQRNLLITIWIHFLVNFTAGLAQVDFLKLFGWMTLGYGIFAVILLIIERRTAFQRVE